MDEKERLMVEAVVPGLEQDGITVKVEEVSLEEEEETVRGDTWNGYGHPTDSTVRRAKSRSGFNGPSGQHVF